MWREQTKVVGINSWRPCFFLIFRLRDPVRTKSTIPPSSGIPGGTATYGHWRFDFFGRLYFGPTNVQGSPRSPAPRASSLATFVGRKRRPWRRDRTRRIGSRTWDNSGHVVCVWVGDSVYAVLLCGGSCWPKHISLSYRVYTVFRAGVTMKLHMPSAHADNRPGTGGVCTVISVGSHIPGNKFLPRAPGESTYVSHGARLGVAFCAAPPSRVFLLFFRW